MNRKLSTFICALLGCVASAQTDSISVEKTHNLQEVIVPTTLTNPPTKASTTPTTKSPSAAAKSLWG